MSSAQSRDLVGMQRRPRGIEGHRPLFTRLSDTVDPNLERARSYVHLVLGRSVLPGQRIKDVQPVCSD